MKWGPFFDNNSRTFSYALTPPTGFKGTIQLVGTGSFDGVDIVAAGTAQFTVESSGGTPVRLDLKLYPGLILTGIVGEKWRIEAAATVNSSFWQTLATVTLANPVELWVDVDGITRPGWFYRGSKP